MWARLPLQTLGGRRGLAVNDGHDEDHRRQQHRQRRDQRARRNRQHRLIDEIPAADGDDSGNRRPQRRRYRFQPFVFTHVESCGHEHVDRETHRRQRREPGENAGRHWQNDTHRTENLADADTEDEAMWQIREACPLLKTAPRQLRKCGSEKKECQKDLYAPENEVHHAGPPQLAMMVVARCGRRRAAAAKCRSLSGLRTTYSARMTSPSISNAAVCTSPSGPSTMTPGSPLMVTKRAVKSSRHPLRATSTRNLATRSAPSSTFCAAGTLPPPSAMTRTSLASSCVSACRSPERVAARNADMSWACLASISPEGSGGVTPRGLTACTCARARVASCRQAVSLRSRAVATSPNEKSKTSCSRKAARSSGDNRSSVKSSAMDRSSANSVWLSGESAAVSTTGSGSHGPTYSSRRARAEVSISRQIRVVVVMRNAFGSDTLSRSVPCQRKYVS